MPTIEAVMIHSADSAESAQLCNLQIIYIYIFDNMMSPHGMAAILYSVLDVCSS